LEQDGGEIQAITAATISSRAVSDGVRKGIEKYTGHVAPAFDKQELFTEASGFIEIIPDTLWYAVTENDTLGIVFVSMVQGYLNDIGFIVGYNKAEEITGVAILFSKETEGLGDKICDKEFLDKFKEGTPEAITGATVSSQALIEGVEKGIKRFEEYLP
jgi:Na+-translocating ferredoxin:NAD+ oxidoreductase RnfG subunit